MFTASLFSDYLKENGLKIRKDDSTRHIICLEFNYGSRSYQKEMEYLYRMAVNANQEYRKAKIQNNKYLTENMHSKKRKIDELLQTAYRKRNHYVQYTANELRTYLYNHGVDVEYNAYDRKGNIKKKEKVHYKMLYRSTGKAKKGSCMFIADRLYSKALKFLRMGIRLPENNPRIVEISAYSSLVSSSIVEKIKIDPKNILVLKDVDRFFRTNIISIETDENKHCYAKKYPIIN